MEEMLKKVLRDAGLSTSTIMLLSTGIHMAVEDIKNKAKEGKKE